MTAASQTQGLLAIFSRAKAEAPLRTYSYEPVPEVLEFLPADEVFFFIDRPAWPVQWEDSRILMAINGRNGKRLVVTMHC